MASLRHDERHLGRARSRLTQAGPYDRPLSVGRPAFTGVLQWFAACWARKRRRDLWSCGDAEQHEGNQLEGAPDLGDCRRRDALGGSPEATRGVVFGLLLVLRRTFASSGRSLLRQREE